MLTPQALAAALGLPRPTDEQAAVIAAPARSALVVAGAGAGKTETMAARVVWLVATGQVLPEQVLGLTFTRKAAQQLGVRVRTRLRRLAGSRLLDDLDPTGRAARRACWPASRRSPPTTPTPGAWSASTRCACPPSPASRLLGSTGAWQLAHRVVSTWADDLDVDRVPATVTGVRPRAGRRARRAPRRARGGPAHAAALAELLDRAPPGPRQRAEPSQRYRRWLEAQRMRHALVPLVEAFAARKRAERALDFGDQLAIAARVAAEHPEVGVAGARHLPGRAARRVPGHRPRPAGAAARPVRRGAGRPGRAQRAGGHRRRRPLPVDLRLARRERRQPRPVPHRLPAPGRGPGRRVRPAHQLPQPAGGARAGEHRVRAAARGARRRGGRRAAPRARARRRATSGSPCCRTSRRSSTGWPTPSRRGGGPRRTPATTPPTSAVLVRRRADMDAVAAALRARDLPVEVVGLGGLLDTPEVRDLVSALRLVADPLAGPAAVRLLTGPRWRLGVADLAALWARARELAPGPPPSSPRRRRAAELALGALPGRARRAGRPGRRPGRPGRARPLLAGGLRPDPAARRRSCAACGPARRCR